MANTIRLKRGTTEPAPEALVTGELAINTSDGAVYTKMDDGTVTPIVGKVNQLTVSVRNETGTTIPAACAVYISGASSSRPLIAPSQANTASMSSKTLGLTTAAIDTGHNGQVVVSGTLTKIDTQSYQAGAALWLSPTTAGGLTATIPTQPNHIVFIGTVINSASNGKIEVKVQNGYEIGELHDVSITSVTNGQVLTYDSVTGLWKNATPASGGGGGTWGSITGTLSNQTDLNNALTAKASLASPTFTGTPAATTATAGTNTTQLATTAFVLGQVATAAPLIDGTAAVGTSLLYARQDHVHPTDTTRAPLASPSMTGVPLSTTAAVDTNTTQIATTAFVVGQAGAATPLVDGTAAVGTSLRYARADHVHPTDTTRAALNSPTFTGTPSLPTGTTAVTQTAGNNTTALATTAFVTTADNLKANLNSPSLTGTPLAPTATTGTNTNQIATTAYVKSNLTSYATLAGNPAFTGSPTATTQAYNTSGGQLATTAYAMRAGQRPKTELYGSQTGYGALDEKVHYSTIGNNAHTIGLYLAGYLNNSGAILMFVQNDNAQMAFDAPAVAAPNGDRYYAAFPGAVVFAVKSDNNSWNIYGDLTNISYLIYGTVISGPIVNTGRLVASGYMDYNSIMVYAYTYEQEIATGWGSTTVVDVNAPYGTTMSSSFQYNSTEYYYLTADGSGGYSLTFDYSTGGSYDSYGTKYGTPYWDSYYNGLYQSIADGNGGNTSISWDGYTPYPTYGTQISNAYSTSGILSDVINQSFFLNYDQISYADGYGGSYGMYIGLSSGNYFPYGWAFENLHFDTNGNNMNTTYYYWVSSMLVYPWAYGYYGADGNGGTFWFTYDGSSYASYGTRASPDFYDQSYNYIYIVADGNGGFTTFNA